MEFEWDLPKAITNRQKHGVSFEEAATVFADPLAAIFSDPDHSEDETRELIVGYSDRGRLLIVSFTERPPNLRIISARVTTPNERRIHQDNPPGAS
jgi:uncharacterized protein